MKARSVRTIIIAQASLTDVHTALDLLRNGSALTSGQSGVVAEAALGEASLVLPMADPFWNGTKHVVFVRVTTN